MNEIQASEEAKRKAVERANAYRTMMDTWAWKDLMKYIEETQATRVSALLDGIDDSLEFTRGWRKAITNFQEEIGYILDTK